jgi:hypothetical protein
MKSLCGVIVVIAGLSFGVSAATAAVEVGNDCTADVGNVNRTFIQLSKAAGDPLPITVPTAGVVTKWKTTLIPFDAVLDTQLKVLRSVGPNQFVTVAQSPPTRFFSGVNNFETRIPVLAGDRFGTGGSAPTGTGLYCEKGAPGDVMGAFNGDTALGAPALFTEQPGSKVAVSATVEPDVDGDGYGDETQDKCPQRAAFQTACPPVALSATSAAGKGLVSVLVTANEQASVTVTGAVVLGKGKSAQLSGGTQIVVPGTIAKFVVLFPQQLKSKLKQLRPKKFLTLNLAATAPNLVGAASASNLTVKLRGQAKPKRHKKAKAKH